MRYGGIVVVETKKFDWGKIGYLIGATIIAWIALGPWIAWLMGEPTLYRPKEGDECSPRRHWVYVRTSVADPDLSCEEDR